jgi:hypothetical protein
MKIINHPIQCSSVWDYKFRIGDLGFQIQVLCTKALLTILDICTKHSKHKTVQNVCLVYLVEKPRKTRELNCMAQS